MYRERILVGNDLKFRKYCLAHFQRRLQAVTDFGDDISELSLFPGIKLGVKLELRQMCTVRL